MLKSIATFTIISLLILPVANAAEKTGKKHKPAKKDEATTETTTTTETNAAGTGTQTTTTQTAPAATATTTTLTAAPAEAAPARTEVATTTTTTTTTAVNEPTQTRWDYVAGGLVKSTWTMHLDISAEFQPSLGIAYALSDMVEIGASISASLQDNPTNGGGSPVSLGGGPGVYAQLPIRLALLNTERSSLAIKLSPGVSIYNFGPGFREVSILLGVAINYGCWVVPTKLMIGGGMDAFMALPVNPAVAFRTPFLFGPIVEYNFIEHFGIYGEAKVGFAVDSHQSFQWAQRIIFGLAAHL